MTTASTFFNSASHNKDIEFTKAELENEYSAFVVNKMMSFHADSALVANELNIRRHIKHFYQYEFLKYIVPDRKRKVVWLNTKKDDTLSIISDYYSISIEKAEYYKKILNNDQIEDIKIRMGTGGKGKKNGK